MSATATAPVDPQLARPRIANARPHLVLVPAGAKAMPAMPATRPTEPVMRLTRFGRLLIALLVATALTAGAVTAAQHLTSMSALSAPGATITVEPGDTLSQIAAQRLPELPIAEGVVAIQLANDLSSPQIHAGETLTVPAG